MSPRHIDFPLHFDGRGNTAEAGYAEHVRDLVEQLLFTAPGERVNRPEFGSGLRQLVFAPNSEELAAALQYTTQAALMRYLGDLLDLQTLEVSCEDNMLRVFLVYALRRTGEVRTESFSGSLP